MNLNVPEFHNISGYGDAVGAPSAPRGGSGPQTGGLPFRIDHDEVQPDNPPAISVRLGSVGGVELALRLRMGGLGAFAADTTTPVDLSGLTNDHRPGHRPVQRVKATLTAGFTSCLLAVQVLAGQHSRTRDRERRQEPSPNCPAQPVYLPSARTTCSTRNVTRWILP